MAKIVIVAPADVDVTDAVKLLKGAGNDVDVEEPTPKSLLHIVLGLFGTNAYGFGSSYAVAQSGGSTDLPPPDDSEEAIEGEATDDGTSDDLDNQDDVNIPDAGDADDFNFENFTIDGEPIEASKTDLDYTVLIVEELVLGQKTTYKLNESKFSFWPADTEKPMQRVDVGVSSVHTSLEVAVCQGDKQELKVGKDLQAILGIKESKESGKYTAHENYDLKDGTWYVEDEEGKLHMKGLQDWEAKEMAKKLNGEPTPKKRDSKPIPRK